MRTLPLVLWHRGSDSELIADAHLQSRITHGDPYCQICCALYCLWARYTLDCIPDPWHTASTILRWRKQLRGQEIFQPLLDRLLSHRS